MSRKNSSWDISSHVSPALTQRNALAQRLQHYLLISLRNHLANQEVFSKDRMHTLSERQIKTEATACEHCGDTVPLARRLHRGERWFCCSGCEGAFALLNEAGLGKFYELRGERLPVTRLRPADSSNGDRYAYLDEARFREEARIKPEAPSIDCFLEGAHCTACVWVVERLPTLTPSVRSARLDLRRSVVRLEIAPGGHFADACLALSRLGYTPHPLLPDDEVTQLERREDRRTLMRLAVAGAIAGNVMMLSAALYTGATGAIATMFRWSTVLVALPSFAWSALPFYRSAWASLRLRSVSIDVPISLALILGYLASLYSVVQGSNEIYLDSLASLIFLLLSSRYVMKRLQRARLDRSGLFRLFTAEKARVFFEGAWRDVAVDSLRATDLVSVEAGQVFPCDGILESGKSEVDASLLTGESRPFPISVGARVFAGTRNLDSSVLVRLTARASDSRLGRIADAIAEAPVRSSRSMRTADRAARYFVSATLVVAAGVILFFVGSDINEGFRRALCLVVVACPCALALATPLALTHAYRDAAARGALLKSPEVIDDLAEIRTLFLDKTGTLTRGRPVVTAWQWLAPQERSAHELIESAVYSIESRSHHPIARALQEHLQNKEKVRLLPVEVFRETPGAGVEGRVNGSHYRVGRLFVGIPNDGATWIAVQHEEQLVARVAFRDEARPEARPLVEEWRKSYSVKLLSGDGRAAVKELATELGLRADEASSGLTPEEKASLVTQAPHALMVGDGANDALALSRANVGVAVRGSLEVAAQAADVILLHDGLEPLADLLAIAKHTRRLLLRNYLFSGFYNLIGATLAVTGHIGPLFAAIVMPVSALTIFLSTIYGAKRKEGPWK